MISQSVFIILPGRQPVNYYLCTNQSDFSQTDNSSIKLNWSLMLVQILSFAVHVFVNVKIKILTAKQRRSLDVLTVADQQKFGDISLMDSRSISDFLTTFLTVASSSSFIIAVFIVNRTNPLEFNKVTFCNILFFKDKFGSRHTIELVSKMILINLKVECCKSNKIED